MDSFVPDGRYIFSAAGEGHKVAVNLANAWIRGLGTYVGIGDPSSPNTTFLHDEDGYITNISVHSNSLFGHTYGEAHAFDGMLYSSIALGILSAALWGLRGYYFYKNRHAIKEVATDLKNGAVNFFRNKVFDREQYRGLKNASYLFNNLSI